MSFKPLSLCPANPTTVRAQATKLGVGPKGDKLVYANGRTIIVRDLKELGKSFAFTGHTQPTTVAKISPSGYYVASADAGGTVKVWDLVGEDKVEKLDIKIVAGRINDLAWDGESKRIIAVGDGRERYGHVFDAFTGNSVGEISGHSKPINAVAVRAQRPFRAATASDDCSVVFYHGAPYKFNSSTQTHTRFIQSVAYAPSGEVFASAGSDSKIVVYDGTSGQVKFELTSGHSGFSIFAVSFSPSSRFLLSSGADGFAKVWDLESRKVVEAYDLASFSRDAKGMAVADDQQVGNAWLNEEEAVSLSLSGDLNVLSRKSPGKASKVLYGPNKSISAFLSVGGKDGILLAGSYDGATRSFSASTGECTPLKGVGHSNAVVAFARGGSEKVFSAGMDDSIREIVGSSFGTTSSATAGLPKSISATSGGVVFAATPNAIQVFESAKPASTLRVNYNPTVIAVSLNGSEIAVGGEDSKVYLYSYTPGAPLKELAMLANNRSALSALAFSPNGKYLAAGESNGKIMVYDVSERKVKLSQWVFHTGKVVSIDWSPDGTHAVSGSLDTNVYVWSLAKPMRNIAIKNVHAGGVTGVQWLDDTEVATSGADGCVRRFAITRHA